MSLTLSAGILLFCKYLESTHPSATVIQFPLNAPKKVHTLKIVVHSFAQNDIFGENCRLYAIFQNLQKAADGIIKILELILENL